MNTSDLPPMLLGRYVPIRKLGKGAMGVVYLANDTELDRPVAIKFSLRPENKVLEKRFELEARSLARLDHPGVVKIYSHGVDETQLYLVLEFIEGKNLLKASIDDPLKLMMYVAEALHAVHEEGLFHRDVKPANILLSETGRPVLVDFGIAFDEDEERLTKTGALVGTPLYSAPELLKGECASRASDFYSWGATLFSLLEGKPYVTTENVWHWAFHGELKDPWKKTASSHPARILAETCLHYDPSRRPQNLVDLQEKYRSRHVTKRTLRPVETNDSGPTTKKTKRPASDSLKIKKFRYAPWIAGFFGVVFLCFAILLANPKYQTPEANQSPVTSLSQERELALKDASRAIDQTTADLARLLNLDETQGAPVVFSRMTRKVVFHHLSGISDLRFLPKLNRFQQALEAWIGVRAQWLKKGENSLVLPEEQRIRFERRILGIGFFGLSVWRDAGTLLMLGGLEVLTGQEVHPELTKFKAHHQEIRIAVQSFAESLQNALSPWTRAGRILPTDLLILKAIARSLIEAPQSGPILLEVMERLEGESPGGMAHLLAATIEFMLRNLVFRTSIPCDVRTAVVKRMSVWVRPLRKGITERQRWLHRLRTLLMEVQLSRICPTDNPKRRDSRIRGYIDEIEARGSAHPDLMAEHVKMIEKEMRLAGVHYEPLSEDLKQEHARMKILRGRYSDWQYPPQKVGP